MSMVMVVSPGSAPEVMVPAVVVSDPVTIAVLGSGVSARATSVSGLLPVLVTWIW